MKKILRAVNTVLAAAVMAMSLFVPFLKVSGGDFGAETLSFFGITAGDHAYPQGIAAFLASVVIPAFLIMSAAILHQIAGGKFRSDIISASVSAAGLIFSGIMVPFFLCGAVESDDKTVTVSAAAIIPAFICVICAGCALMEFILSMREKKLYAEALKRQPDNDRTILQESPGAAPGIGSVPPYNPGMQNQYSQQQMSQPMQNQYSQQQVSQPMQNQYSQQQMSQPMQNQYSQQQMSQPMQNQYSQQQMSQPMQNQYSQQVKPVNAIPEPVLRCISGEYEGAEFPCEGTTIIGSDPNIANIIISGEKISERHCTIVYLRDSQTYTVTDGSLYGVFISPDGSRLPAHITISLPRGTVISLGSDANRFQLV